MKDAFFLVKNEIDWEDRFSHNQSILANLQKIDGADSIFESFQKCKNLSTTDTFILIDGDTRLLPSAAALLNENRPSVFYSTNKYGVKYGHGGVKIMDRSPTPRGGSAYDITSRLNLITVHSVISVHEFDFSKENTWRTLFKELLKLYMWGESETLFEWLTHEEPKSVFVNDVLPFIRQSTIKDLATIVHDRNKLQDLFNTSKSCLRVF